MRTQTFISSMVGVVAAAALAGSANAAVVSLFDFTTGVSTKSDGSVTGSNPFSLWDTSNEINVITTSATGSGGAITMASTNVSKSAGGPVADFTVLVPYNPNPPYNYYSSVDLSGATAIEFNVTAYSGVATHWNLYVYDENHSNYGDLFVSSTGTKSFSTAGWDIDLSKVVGVELQVASPYLPSTDPLRTNSNWFGTFSFTFNGMNAVVPAPGAAALVGLAGLVATRRRRN